MESQSLSHSSSSYSPSAIFVSSHPSPFLSPPHTQSSCFSGNRILSFLCSTQMPEPEEETPNTLNIRTLEEREPNSIMDLHHHNSISPPFYAASSEQPCSPPWAFSAGVAAGFRPWLVACNQNSESECRGETSDQKKLPSPFIGWTPLENPDGHCIIKERMTQALRYFKESTEQHVLAQVWAPIKNGGRCVLTTAGQPFVVDPNSNGLYEYRMVSLRYMFSVDGENDGVLDILGRVFRQKLPEWTPDVQYYTSKEYLRLDYALHHNVHGTLALPVFEPSGQCCLGVLELIMTSRMINYAPEVDKVCKALEAVNLKSSEILDHSRTQICNKGRHSALVEILEILTVVCETHKLPLAQTWVPCRHRSVLADGGGLKKSCSSFDGSCMGRVCMSTSDVAFYLVDAHMWGFREACAEHHLQKGQGVAGKAFLSQDACFCKDVTQFCKIQYPLVHYARMFGLTSCFAICLRSSYTGHDDYVLEFFLPPSITNSYEQQRLLGSLLVTMKEHLKSLKVASGKEIEEVEPSIEMIQALPNEKLDSTPKSPQLPSPIGSPPGLNKSSTDGEMEPVILSNQQLIAEVDVVADRAATENVIPCAEDNGAKKKVPKKQGKAEKTISLDVLQQYHAGSLKDAPKSLCGIPSNATSGVEYEVILSFRGPDTRYGLTDHLYTRLTDAGIKVYRDDEELQVGEEIGPELLKGITQSKMAIPIFSKGYATSKWCLKELAHIVECKRSTGLKVMPIFYDVMPSEVRNQTGDYGEAFKSHEKCYGENIVREWKEALRQVGYMKGWDAQSNRNRQEGKLVKEVTKVILHELKKAYLVVTNHLVGVEHQVEKILKMITAESGGVRIGGIYGMGGIGKTTLAKVVYNHLLPHFESYSFLADIRENCRSKGIEFLQKKLILDILKEESVNFSNKDEGIAIISKRFSNKKVLILWDDVDEYFQLEALTARRDQFGYGSRIIITTRNKSLLDSVQVDWSHEVSGMDSHQALQLFSMHAFRKNQPPKEYATLSKRVVKTTGGLPLALQVVGSLLCGRSKKGWDFTLKKLERVPHDKVCEKLRISFEELDDQQKQVFLDIACFFIGVDVRIINHFWDDSQLCPEEAIEVLLQMSLIKVQEDNSLWMHDQLRDLGREIIRQEHIEPEKRSRLWNQEEATKLFLSNMGDENVHGICLDLSQQPRCSFSEEFAKLPNLRLLHVNSSNDEHFIQKEWFFRNKLYSRIVSSNCFHKSPHIFPKLRLLSWHFFPKTNATSYLSLENLAILDLSWSKIKSSWGGWRHTKMATNLKVLNLTGCSQLVRTPDFSSHLLLERLILERCYELVEIDASISKLKHLAFVNLKYCRSLRKLPKELSCMKCLEELVIDKTSIVEIPNWRHMEELKVFSACYCQSLNKFSSLDFIASISKLSLDYSSITSLPDSIGKLVNLLKLSLVYCKGLKELPESIGNLASLIELDLSFSGVVEIPHTIGNLKNLKSLSVCRTPIRNLPAAIGMMESLLTINAEYCCYLHDLPKLPQSLISLRASHLNIERVPDLSNLINLKNLALWLVEEPCRPFEASCPTLWWIRRLTNLETLSLGCTYIISLPVELGALSQLTVLELFHCDKLKTIPMLPSSLTRLLIAHCSLLQTLLYLPSGLTKLSIHYCSSIGTTLDISYLRKLSYLSIQETPISKLEGLCSCQSLQELHISCCSFSEIDDLEMLENLTSLSIHFCVQLRGLPDLLNLKMLKSLEISYCDNLVVFPGRMESLDRFDIDSCKSLKKIPDVPHSQTMSHFFIRNCGKLNLPGQ